MSLFLKRQIWTFDWRQNLSNLVLYENSIIPAHLPLADDFESKFQFHPVEDLPPPDEFKPFPRIYPSKENRGSSTFLISQLYPWLHYHLLTFSSSFLSEPQTTWDEDTPQMSQTVKTQSSSSLLMTITELPWTWTQGLCVCVVCFLVYLCMCVCV